MPATIAHKRGRVFYNWWCYGFLLFPVALIHALFLRETDNALVQSNKMKVCPFCAELIKPQARVCRYCQKSLDS
ncbi:MAG: zinc ribbon domain-containing protein [Hormoscilla sp. GM7CHS1pb]|nr:zinc ribbon domain-containing protein [Hormoscilla sp. GM7CHS1pb]